MESISLSPAALKEGLAYAEHNLLPESRHLIEAKEVILRNFDMTDKHILDFGSGMGAMTLWVAEKTHSFIDGFDIDPNHVAVSQELLKRYPNPRVSFDVRNIIENPIDKQYDMIMLTDVVEHLKLEWLPHIFKILITRNLKPGGTLFLCYPPWEGPQASHMKTPIKIPWIQFLPHRWVVAIMRKYNRPNVGRGDMLQDYLELNHINHARLMKLLAPFGLERTLRVSHTKFNALPFLRHTNLNFFPFIYLVTHEIIAFKKPNE